MRQRRKELAPQGSWQRLGSMFQVRDLLDVFDFEDGALAFNSVLYLFTLKTGVGGVGVVQLVGGFGGGFAMDAPDEDSGYAAVTGWLYVLEATLWIWLSLKVLTFLLLMLRTWLFLIISVCSLTYRSFQMFS